MTASDSHKSGYQVHDERVLRRWNWGAFFLTPFWTLRHGLDWWFILSIMPGIAIFARFYMGWYGNRLAFERSRVRSIERFMKVQRAWTIYAILILTIFILSAISWIFV